MWFEIAAAFGSETARMARDHSAHMTPDQVAAARRMAREWLAEHQQNDE